MISNLAKSIDLSRRAFLREPAIFLVFLGLTVLMMWPWILHIRDAVSDQGDSYAHAYWVWWGGHQLFHDPLNLFNATIFYPYQNTLAFSENDFGIALLFAPLQALGFRPVTVLSIATLLAYPFSAYGMFRLTRTLTRSSASACVSGIVFAFLPYHFQRLPHLPIIFAGWIPLTLEALVLFARQRSWRRATWLSVAFTMNAFTCVSLFILTLIPFVLSAGMLVVWWQAWRDKKFWIRGGLLFGAAAVVVSLFLYPYYRVNQMYGFTRTAVDASGLSALPIHWLAVSERNRFWKGLGGKAAVDELTLFPGFLPPLIGLAAFFLVKPLSGKVHDLIGRVNQRLDSRRLLLFSLDVVAFALLMLAFLTAGYGWTSLRLFGFELVRSVSPGLFFGCFFVVLGTRFWLAYPEAFRRIADQRHFLRTFIADPRSLALIIGSTWLVTGFLGSFGMNFFFHRILFEFVPFFKSMRAPVRWAMVCYVGLSILAGMGAPRIVDWVTRWIPRAPRGLIYAVLVVLILSEQRVAPIQFARGEVDPDEISLRLKVTPMSGGIVELPAEKDNYAYYRYMLRAADHGRPIVTASSSFAPPIVREIEWLTQQRPIPERFIVLLEEIPASYLVVHKSLLTIESRPAIDFFITREIASGRLRLIGSFGNPEAPGELYAVTKVEPETRQ